MDDFGAPMSSPPPPNRQSRPSTICLLSPAQNGPVADRNIFVFPFCKVNLFDEKYWVVVHQLITPRTRT